MEYSSCGSSYATRTRAIAMMRATMPSIRSVLRSLAGLEIAGGVRGDGYYAGLPERVTDMAFGEGERAT
jgi:hypothetical protein